MPRLLYALLPVVLAVGLLGCDTTATQPESQVVVEAYLEAEAPLRTVRLTRSVDVDTTYDPQRAALRDADVVLQQLNADSSVATSIPYRESESDPGVYVPTRQITVQPQTMYRLQATPPTGEAITATTTVPDTVRAVRTENDTVTYPTSQEPEPPQFSLTVRPGTATLERQNVYVLTATSLLDFQNTPKDSLRRQLTPFYADTYDPDTDTLSSFRVNSSGLLNEANFARNDDGTLTIRLPWLAVAFYGPNRIDANVVDDNLYDLLRTQQAQQMSLAPGEIPNVIEHIDGGTGIFGSYARVGADVLVRRSPSE
ncbi:MAG: DUF4249 family protein [Salinivenus sp.]